jgi:hypothetical protein
VKSSFMCVFQFQGVLPGCSFSDVHNSFWVASLLQEALHKHVAYWFVGLWTKLDLAFMCNRSLRYNQLTGSIPSTLNNIVVNVTANISGLHQM